MCGEIHDYKRHVNMSLQVVQATQRDVPGESNIHAARQKDPRMAGDIKVVQQLL